MVVHKLFQVKAFRVFDIVGHCFEIVFQFIQSLLFSGTVYKPGLGHFKQPLFHQGVVFISKVLVHGNVETENIVVGLFDLLGAFSEASGVIAVSSHHVRVVVMWCH